MEGGWMDGVGMRNEYTPLIPKMNGGAELTKDDTHYDPSISSKKLLSLHPTKAPSKSPSNIEKVQFGPQSGLRKICVHFAIINRPTNGPSLLSSSLTLPLPISKKKFRTFYLYPKYTIHTVLERNFFFFFFVEYSRLLLCRFKVQNFLANFEKDWKNNTENISQKSYINILKNFEKIMRIFTENFEKILRKSESAFGSNKSVKFLGHIW